MVLDYICHLGDHASNVRLRLVVPDSNDVPPVPTQRPKVSTVACPVSRDLLTPIRLKPLAPYWKAPAMPEIPSMNTDTRWAGKITSGVAG